MKSKTILVFWFVCGGLCAQTPRPEVKDPRSTSGDHSIEPNWKETLVVTVGQGNADLIGTNEKVIQAAIDLVSQLGGGTVKLLPGTYRLRNSVFLRSKVKLMGTGKDTVLFKEPSKCVKLLKDSDWYDQEITLENDGGFRPGDGITLRGREDHRTSETVIKRTLIARSGNRFKLDRPLRENFWRMGNARAISVFPMVCGDSLSQASVENLTLDGNQTQNENLDGNYGGCLFFQDCDKLVFRGVTARNFNGDGISWQICHDVLVEDCLCENNAQLGLHPGSGSQRPIIRNNRLVNNDIGIFFCWGVKYGLAEKNLLEGNRVGISIGHRDTDNLITGNTLTRSKEVGILFRPERGKDFAGHRNRIMANQFTDNGPPNGAVIEIQGQTDSIVIEGNRFLETREKGNRVAVRVGPQTENIQLSQNTFTGFQKETEKGK